MKNKLILAAGIILALILASLAGCSTKGIAATDSQSLNVNIGNQQTGIWVSGEGKITVTPDIATITLGVSAQAETVAEAQTEAATAMDQIMNSLTGNGIAKKDIQTQYYNIHQVTRWDDKGQQEIVIGYRVNNTVIAKIREIEKAGMIIDAVAAAGGDLTRINGISFSVDDPSQYYSQARDLAMMDAKAKAEQMANLSGITLGKPFYVTENSYSQPIPYREAIYKMDAMSGAVPTTPITAGEMDITLNVQVAYSIE